MASRPVAGDKMPRFVHPPLGTTVASAFPTPLIEDLVVVVAKEVNTTIYQVEEYGSKHPDTDKYPNHKLVLIQLSEDGIKAKWFYVADRANQDLYNFALKFEGESHGSPIYVRQYVLPREGYEPVAYGTADSAEPNAVLIHEEVLGPADGELAGLYIKVVRVFEEFPGPFVTTTRIDEDGATVTINTRKNLAANITSGETLVSSVWTKTTAKGDNSLVADEVVETRAVPGNAMVTTKVDADGKILTTTKTLKAVSAITSTETVGGGNWVRKYQEDAGGSNLVAYEVVETRAIPGNPIPSAKVDKDGVELDVVKTLKASSAITVGETLATGVWTRTDKEPVTDLVSYEVVTARAVPGNDVPSAVVEGDHETAVVNTRLVDESTITPGATESGGFITTIEQSEVSDLVSERKTTVKKFLDAALYTTSIENLIPVEFRAQIPTHVESHIVAGTAAEPTLLTGEFERSEKQVTKLLKEVRFTILDSIGSLPISISGIKETNAQKQVVSVSMTLEADSTPPTAPTATMDVDFKKLGNGLAIETKRTVPDVFANEVSATSIRDAVPEEFKALIPTFAHSITDNGTITVPPTLGTGEFSRREEQVTDLTFRRTTETRDGLTLPFTISPPSKELTTQFGGTILKTVLTLDSYAHVASPAPDTGLMVVSSEVKNLGTGLFLKITKRADTDTAWPTLARQSFDKEMQVDVFEEEQAVDPSYTPATGTYFVESLTPIDKWRSKRVKLTKTPTAVAVGSALVEEVDGPFQFPGLAPTANKIDYRRVSAMLCQHIIRTWWVSNPVKPTIATDEIKFDTIVLNSINGGGSLEQADNVLHNSGFFGGGYWFGATTPTYSQYVGWEIRFGTGSWTFTAGSTSVTGSGTAFLTELSAGDVVGRYWGQGGTPITVASIGSNTTLTLSAAFPVSGVAPVYFSRDLGSRWIGTEKVTAASVEPTDIPELWKIQTKSVVMR